MEQWGRAFAELAAIGSRFGGWVQCEKKQPQRERHGNDDAGGGGAIEAEGLVS